MGLRQTLNEKKSVSISGVVLLFVLAASYFIYTQWPYRRPKGDKAFYTVDDGQTWFIDSSYKVPPFDYNGQTAVRAILYSYDNGSKRFCPYLMQYQPSMKKALDDAVAQANHDGKPLSSISLFNSQAAAASTEVKICGPGHKWVPSTDYTNASQVFATATAPDGSAVDLIYP
jgi:hypothetical protein